MMGCLEKALKRVIIAKLLSCKQILFGGCSVPKNCPNYVDSQSHKKSL